MRNPCLKIAATKPLQLDVRKSHSLREINLCMSNSCATQRSTACGIVKTTLTKSTTKGHTHETSDMLDLSARKHFCYVWRLLNWQPCCCGACCGLRSNLLRLRLCFPAATVFRAVALGRLDPEKRKHFALKAYRYIV